MNESIFNKLTINKDGNKFYVHLSRDGSLGSFNYFIVEENTIEDGIEGCHLCFSPLWMRNRDKLVLFDSLEQAIGILEIAASSSESGEDKLRILKAIKEYKDSLIIG